MGESHHPLPWDALDYDWWTSMPECEGARAFYEETRAKTSTRFLSAPVLSEDCFSGKAHWVQEFTGSKFALSDLMLVAGKDKQMLAAMVVALHEGIELQWFAEPEMIDLNRVLSAANELIRAYIGIKSP